MPSEQAIDYAVRKIGDLIAVQQGKDPQLRKEGVNRFAEAVGITDDLRGYLVEQLESVLTEDSSDLGFLTLGIYMGLFVAEYVAENET